MLLLLESVFFKIYLVSSFWLCWLFIAVHGLSVVAEVGLFPGCGPLASHCSGFSYCRAWAPRVQWLQYLQHMGLVVVALRLSCPSACGFFGMGIVLVSPAGRVDSSY